MSCGCGVLKENACEAGVFGIVKLGLSGTKDKAGETKVASKLKNRILMETAVFGLSGVAWDWTIYNWLSTENQRRDLGMDMTMWTPAMLKSIYQLLVLGGYDFAMGKKMNIQKFLEATIAVWSANYGLEMLKM